MSAGADLFGEAHCALRACSACAGDYEDPERTTENENEEHVDDTNELERACAAARIDEFLLRDETEGRIGDEEESTS